MKRLMPLVVVFLFSGCIQLPEEFDAIRLAMKEQILPDYRTYVEEDENLSADSKLQLVRLIEQQEGLLDDLEKARGLGVTEQ